MSASTALRPADRRRSDAAIQILDSWFPQGVADPSGEIEKCLSQPSRPTPIIRNGRVRVMRKVSKGQIHAYAVAQHVREFRLMRGLRQQDLAEKSGIARPNIARLEQGKHLPSTATLRRIAKALGVSLSRLVEQPHAGRSGEDRMLAESGLAGWVSNLEKEDRQ